MINLKSAALAYAAPNGLRGSWAIFPLVPGGKKPLPGGQGFKEATTDVVQIEKWWTKTPMANIGIACGSANGFIVIDVDRGHNDGIDGSETLRDLERKMGKLPDTVVALTPNGGSHLFFKYPTGENIRCKVAIAPGIDIRADGGYVVGAPSILSNGRSYVWELSSLPEENEIADLPDIWKKWLVTQCGRFVLPEETSEGNRNNTLYRYAASLRAQGYKPESMRELLVKYNLDHCKPSLSEQEVNQIYTSILRYPPGTPVKLIDAAQTTTQISKRPRLTQVALVEEMQSRGFSVRYNVITCEYETLGRTQSGRAMGQDDLVTFLQDALADKYKGVTFDILTQYIGFQARENQYNPVLELLEATQWDEVDRLQELFELIGVESDELSKLLIKKWLYQTIALLFNNASDPFGADGCLVLNGEQGTGKTSLFRHLALKDAWFGEGLSIDDHDKDTERRVITKWISELGEVESTLKSDVSRLKAFVTSSVDRYRLPYGRSDIVAPRLTSLCATCNSDKYLIDPTGNRRWWSVPFTHSIPREKLEKLDALQLWAQIYSFVAPLDYKEKAACFRLTEDEKKLLAARNGEYEKPVKGQAEVAEILYLARIKGLSWKKMTVSEFKTSWEVLRQYSSQQISTAIKACGIEIHRVRAGAVAELPKP